MLQGDWVRTVAKQDGIPVYALKSSGKANLVKGLRTLLGIDPSAGGSPLGAQSSDEGRPLRADVAATASRVRSGSQLRIIMHDVV